MNADRIDAMKRVGNEWTRGDHHRIYFDVEMDKIGLEVWYYNSGNVSSAKYDGIRISNAAARRMIGKIGTVFYDLNAEKMVFQNWRDDELKERAKSLINSQINAETVN